jgi:hypothetical protein
MSVASAGLREAGYTLATENVYATIISAFSVRYFCRFPSLA